MGYVDSSEENFEARNMSCTGYSTGSAFKVAKTINPRSVTRLMLKQYGISADQEFDPSMAVVTESDGFLQAAMEQQSKARLKTGRTGTVVSTLHGSTGEHYLVLKTQKAFYLLSDHQISTAVGQNDD